MTKKQLASLQKFTRENHDGLLEFAKKNALCYDEDDLAIIDLTEEHETSLRLSLDLLDTLACEGESFSRECSKAYFSAFGAESKQSGKIKLVAI